MEHAVTHFNFPIASFVNRVYHPYLTFTKLFSRKSLKHICLRTECLRKSECEHMGLSVSINNSCGYIQCIMMST